VSEHPRTAEPCRPLTSRRAVAPQQRGPRASHSSTDSSSLGIVGHRLPGDARNAPSPSTRSSSACTPSRCGTRLAAPPMMTSSIVGPLRLRRSCLLARPADRAGCSHPRDSGERTWRSICVSRRPRGSRPSRMATLPSLPASAAPSPPAGLRIRTPSHCSARPRRRGVLGEPSSSWTGAAGWWATAAGSGHHSTGSSSSGTRSPRAVAAEASPQQLSGSCSAALSRPRRGR
jgi:hypothetical protein